MTVNDGLRWREVVRQESEGDYRLSLSPKLLQLDSTQSAGM
jgi:hypothetical protein